MRTLPLKHKQPLGFLCGLLGVLIALPACGVLHRQRPIPRPVYERLDRSGEKVHKNEWLPKALGFESRSHTFAPFLPPFCYFLQEMGLIEVEVAARRRV